MKIIFWGTSKFAIPVLEKVVQTEHRVVAVVTQKDKKQGRHLLFKSPPVKVAAQKLNLTVLQPEDINSEGFIRQLKSLEPDLFIVASYGKILRASLLFLPRLYSINLHASLLPKYRGAAPINWALLKGETETGVTVIKMNEKMDAGEIIAQEKVSISESDTSMSLGEKLENKGADLVIEVLKLIDSKKARFKPQNDEGATFAPLLKKEDGKIFWNEPAVSIHNKIRALQPWPGAWCLLNEKLVKLWKTKIIDVDSDKKPGEIAGISKEGIIVSLGKGSLLIEELQLSSGKRMMAQDFVLGHNLKKGASLK
ncbi:MAG: methionyl-tRNA formyltransferase [Candidatus Omnitrophica bacterium]|nr:methionyl-tRNA formyltransferase [Candidatus Omnitrophota bacterium]